MSAIIEISDYSWRYLAPKPQRFKNINLTLDEGKFVGIIGQNGAGKTTPGLFH